MSRVQILHNSRQSISFQSSQLKLSSKSMVILHAAQFFDLKSFEIENLKLKLKFFETVLFSVYTTSFIAWKQA